MQYAAGLLPRTVEKAFEKQCPTDMMQRKDAAVSQSYNVTIEKSLRRLRTSGGNLSALVPKP